MSGPCLVDSNVYSGLLRRGIDPSLALTDWIGDGDLAICGMVRMEVERGLKVERIRRRLSSFFDVLLNIPTTNRIWEEAAAQAWSLDRRGLILPAQDILIAVCAKEIGASVLSDDRHFDLLPGLRVLRPEDTLKDW
jgi:predicted nucleic acid-binding protein